MSGEPEARSLLYADPAVVRRCQDAALRRTMDVVGRASQHYRARWRAAGVDPSRVQGIDDLPALPVTTKTDFLATPDEFRLDPLPDAALEERVLWEVIYTTGTTSGAPAPIYVTTSDYWAYLVHARRCAELLAIGERDVIANLFPLTAFPMGAYVRANATAAAVGAALVRAHTGRPVPGWPVHRRLDDAVRLVADHRATVLWGVAGFVRRFLMRAAELAADLSTVRWAFVTGEATSAEGEADLCRRLAAVGSQGRVANRYGSTEGGSLIACASGAGWHNPTPDQTALEVVDPDSHRPVPDGEPGLLLITHLVQRGTVLLRYAVGDVVALTRERCPACGRTAERIVSQPVRTAGLVKVKGTLVNTGVLRDALERLEGVDEYQVLLDRERPDDPLSSDVLRVRLATAAAEPEALVQRVRASLTELVHVTPEIELVAADAIYDVLATAKPRRVVDLRSDERSQP